MVWPIPNLRNRRTQVRDDIDSALPGADARIPNAPLSILAEAVASQIHDNDAHLEWVARMMMPDTAEGVFAERWGNIWLPQGRKPATFASGSITVTGKNGASVPTGAELTAAAFDDDGNRISLQFEVSAGVTLSGTSATVAIQALTAGVFGNLEAGAKLSFVDLPDGIDGQTTVAAPGLSGGADIEPVELLIERYINRIQEPPHGGNANDWVQWAKEQPGVTRAWGAQEMGVGTYTVRFMMDDVRAEFDGLPQAADLTDIAAAIAAIRPVTVAEAYFLAPSKQVETVTIDNLVGDTPEIRANIAAEVQAMSRARIRPGGIVYASWIREAVSAATGEDHHDLTIGNLTPDSAGHMIFLEVAFV